MSNAVFTSFVHDLLSAPNLFDPQYIYMWRETECPCRHGRIRRLYDWLRGAGHPRTHIVSEPLIRVTLIDNHDPGSEAMTVRWDATGRFTVE